MADNTFTYAFAQTQARIAGWTQDQLLNLFATYIDQDERVFDDFQVWLQEQAAVDPKQAVMPLPDFWGPEVNDEPWKEPTEYILFESVADIENEGLTLDEQVKHQQRILDIDPDAIERVGFVAEPGDYVDFEGEDDNGFTADDVFEGW